MHRSPAPIGRGFFNSPNSILALRYTKIPGLEYGRRMNLSTVFFVIIIILSVGGCTSEPKTGMPAPPSARIPILAATTVLATIGEKEEPSTADPALKDKPVFEVVFGRGGHGVAYVAKSADTFYVVHNGKAGRPYKKIFNLEVSPDGRRVAYVIEEKESIQRLVLDGVEGGIYDDVGRPTFSPDSRHVAYKVIVKGKLHIVVDDKMSKEYTAYNGIPIFSADSGKVSYAEGRDGKQGPRLVISDLAFKKVLILENTGDHMIWNDDNTRLAAIQEVNGKQRVIDISFSEPNVVREGPLYNAVGQIVFGWDGHSLSYAADKGGVPILVLNGKEHPLPDDPMLAEPVVVRGQKVIAAIMANKQVEFAPQALYYDGATEKQYGIISNMIVSRDGSQHAYTAGIGEKWSLVVNGKEGPLFDAVVTPMFTPDGKMVVYRARLGMKRFVVVSDFSGKVLRKHPAYEMVFDMVFTDDGKSVAYGVKDGKKLIWKVEKLDSK